MRVDRPCRNVAAGEMDRVSGFEKSFFGAGNRNANTAINKVDCFILVVTPGEFAGRAIPQERPRNPVAGFGEQGAGRDWRAAFNPRRIDRSGSQHQVIRRAENLGIEHAVTNQCRNAVFRGPSEHRY